MRAVDDPGYVLSDLEFEDATHATSMLEALREMWARASVMPDP